MLTPNTSKTGVIPRPHQVIFKRNSPSEEWKLTCADELAAFLSPETETVLWTFPTETATPRGEL